MNKEITIKECCTLFTDGDWIESKDQSDSGIRLIQTGNIGNGVYLEKKGRAKYISEETMLRLGCTEVYPGDILVSRLPDPVGRACIIPPKIERMITAVDCSILRINDEIVDKRYLLCFLNSPCYYKQITSFLAGTTRIRISRKNLERIIVKLPVREKQLEIAKRIDLLTSIINLQIKTLNKLDELIKSRFVEMFGDIIHDDKIPKVVLSELANIGSSKRIFANEYTDEGIPFYRSKEIRELGSGIKPTTELFISSERYKSIKDKYGVPKIGDILIAAIGATIGYSWIVDTDKPFYYKDGNLILLSLKDCVNSVFLNHTIGILIDDFKKRGVSGSAQLALTIEKLEKMPVINPSLASQNQFANFVSQVEKQKVTVRQSIDKLETLKKSLMQEYFG